MKQKIKEVSKQIAESKQQQEKDRREGKGR
jgi:hypothetical protein